MAEAKPGPTEPTTSGAGSSNKGEGDGDGGGIVRPRARDLSASFTHAIPPACDAMPAWRTLPLGPAGSVAVEIETDEEGRVVGKPRLDPTEAPQHLVDLVTRTGIRLGKAPAALDRGGVGAGIVKLRLVVSIASAPPAPELDGGAFDLHAQFEEPRGVARFTLREGRRVTIDVERVSVSRPSR